MSIGALIDIKGRQSRCTLTFFNTPTDVKCCPILVLDVANWTSTCCGTYR